MAGAASSPSSSPRELWKELEEARAKRNDILELKSCISILNRGCAGDASKKRRCCRNLAAFKLSVRKFSLAGVFRVGSLRSGSSPRPGIRSSQLG